MTFNKPTISEFDGWRNSPVGRWFFDHYLQGYADEGAKINGKAAGTYTSTEDHITLVRNAGFITGVEHAIHVDPLEGERNEAKSNGEFPFS